MKIGKIIGSIVLTNAIADINQERLLIILGKDNKIDIAVDRIGAELGKTVLCSQSKEAMFALGDENRPIDLTVIAIEDYDIS